MNINEVTAGTLSEAVKKIDEQSLLRPMKPGRDTSDRLDIDGTKLGRFVEAVNIMNEALKAMPISAIAEMFVHKAENKPADTTIALADKWAKAITILKQYTEDSTKQLSMINTVARHHKEVMHDFTELLLSKRTEQAKEKMIQFVEAMNKFQAHQKTIIAITEVFKEDK